MTPSHHHLLSQARKAQKEVEFLSEVGEGTASLRELRAAHAETIQELQKTRNILNTESAICKHLQVAAGRRTGLASLPARVGRGFAV